MEKMIVVDAKRCTGCRACEMACSVRHEGVSNPVRARISIIKWESQGFYVPVFCQQCDDAPCAAACPVKAISRDEELGRTVVDHDRCIKCRICVWVCPFGAMGYDAVGRRVVKCDLCDGEPACVAFCDPKALEYVSAEKAGMKKKRLATRPLSELVQRHE